MSTVALAHWNAALFAALEDPATPGTRVGLCNVDEDEATLAVTAGHAAMQAAGCTPGDVTDLVLAADEAATWAPTVQLALGLRGATVAFRPRNEPAPTVAVGRGLTLFVSVRATRAAALSVAPLLGTEAKAALVGPKAARVGVPSGPPPQAAMERRVRSLDPAAVARLARADQRGSSIPMGANVPRATWDATLEARYRLLASICGHCGAAHHPPMDPCASCGRPTRIESLWKPGKLHTWTVVAAGAGPTEFDPWQEAWGEYGVAIVEYGDGLRVAGLVVDTDLDALRVNAPMEPMFRRLYAQDGSWRYGVKFRASG